jgi:hypothetical protein
MKIAGQYTPFWGGQHARFLQKERMSQKIAQKEPLHICHCP